MAAHGAVPGIVVRWIGWSFFRLARVFPPFFGLSAIAGIAVGIWLTWFLDEPGQDIWIQVIGIGCIIFYGGLLTTLIVKLRRKTWNAFCDYCAAEFE